MTYCLKSLNGQEIKVTEEVLQIGRLHLDPGRRASIADLLQERVRIDADCLQLPDPCVSRRHAVLTLTEDARYTISDDGSRSGTFVNGRQIKEATLLQIGDRIQLGQSSFQFCESADLDIPLINDCRD